MTAAPPGRPPRRGVLSAVGLGFSLALESLKNRHHWFLTRALWFLLAFGVIFAADGILVGWSTAYEVMIGIASPADVGYPFVSWPVSVVGWLMIPAFVGGVAGYLVTWQIDGRRTESEAEVARDLRVRAAKSDEHGGAR